MVLDRLTLVVPGPVLQAKAVYLRPPQIGDWTAWARLRAESRDFLTPWEPIWPVDALSRNAYKRRMRRYARDARDEVGHAFFVFRKSDDALVGGITLSNVRRGVTQTASTGYWIGKSFARQGYMFQALNTVVDWVFGQMALHRLEAACLPENEPSKALLQKCGFRQEGYAREYLCINGTWRDHILFALLTTDLRASHTD